MERAIARRRVLVVEDELLVAELALYALTDAGYSCQHVVTADEALALLAAERFCVMVSDVRMPGETDGIELAERCAVLYPRMPTIIVSGYYEVKPGHPMTFPFLAKPYRLEALVREVNAAYSKHPTRVIRHQLVRVANVVC